MENVIGVIEDLVEKVFISLNAMLFECGEVWGQRPARMLRRRNASIFCRSLTAVKPHHAGEAYKRRARPEHCLYRFVT